MEDLNRDYGKDIDSYIRIRETSKNDLMRSRMALLEAGAKTVKGGNLTASPGLDVEKFIRHANQEFSWEAEYKNGQIVKQFEGSRQHHYGNIDQSQLKWFRWISNFNYPTDNVEKRIIVSLDFETGMFSFMNGMIPMELRNALVEGYPELMQPKLILRMVKRTSQSVSVVNGEVDEVTFYNRYLIGWESTQESPTKAKRILCIEPNGNVHFWHDQT